MIETISTFLGSLVTAFSDVITGLVEGVAGSLKD